MTKNSNNNLKKKMKKKENLNKSPKQKTEHIKLDEILKSLFTVSNKVLLNMMNTIFHEDHKIDETSITVVNNEFITSKYDVLRGDLFLELNSEKNQVYHIEFQTKNDKTMIIRMFEYDFFKAKENYQRRKSKEGTEKIVFYMPKSIVMYIEENRNISNQIDMEVVFPDEQEVTYKVPVMKCWKYTTQKMVKNKLYPLLPLQLFKLRKELIKLNKEKTKNKDKITEQMQKVMQRAKQTAEEIAKLEENKEIKPEDMHTILLAINNLFQYLNNRYGNDTKLNKKVDIMTKTLYDPAVEARGIQIGEKRGIKIGEAKGIIRTCIEFGLKDDEILNKLKVDLNIDDEKANKYLNDYYEENKKD